MRNYEDFEREVRRRQELALGWASHDTARAEAPRPSIARVRLAGALRQLAGWVEGAGAASSVTLRPS